MLRLLALLFCLLQTEATRPNPWGDQDPEPQPSPEEIRKMLKEAEISPEEYQDMLLSQPPLLPLVPYPQQLSLNASSEQVVIDPRTFRFLADPASRSLLLAESFNRYHHYLNLHDYNQQLPVTLHSVYVTIKDMSEELVLETSENYTLTVSHTEAQITADTVFGALRALETFSQLVTEEFTIPAVNIKDFPRYKFRGFMLDTSRHFLSISTLKRLIEAASWNKLNMFHWHVVDDPSFPYTSLTYPEMSRAGAYSQDHIYSQEDVIEIIMFAYKHGIITVPEFDTPGHTFSWGKTLPGFLTYCPHKGAIGHDHGPIDPTIEANYDILTNIFTEISKVFPGGWMHLGGDEVYYNCWQSNANITAWMAAHNMTGDYEGLENYYEQRLIKIVNTLNTNYIVWEEIFNHHLDIDPKTIIHAWLPNWKGVFQNATTKGFRTILSSCWYINRISYGEDWKGFYQCDPRSFNQTATQEQLNLVLGGTMCMWGEWVDNSNILSRTFPRGAAPAERLWSAKEINNVNFMRPRLNDHRCRMAARGYPAEPSMKKGYCKHEYKHKQRY